MKKKIAILLAAVSFLVVLSVPAQASNQTTGAISPTGIIGGA